MKHNKRLKWPVFIFVPVVLLALVYFCVQHMLSDSPQSVDIEMATRYPRTILVAADIDYEPYSFTGPDGKPSGYHVELLYHLAYRIKYNIVVKLMNGLDCKRALYNGDVDLAIGLDYGGEDDPNTIYSRTPSSDKFVCFGRKPLSNINQLFGERLAVLDGSDSVMNYFIKAWDLNHYTLYPSYTQVIQSVIDGENDYAFSRYSVGRRILARLGMEREIRAVGPEIPIISDTIYALKENQALINALDEGVAALVADGTFDTLPDKWMGHYVEVITLADFLRVYSRQLFCIALALVLLLELFTVLIARSRVKAANAQRQAELADMKMAIMRSQIRQHFLANTLLAIRDLSEINPDEAGKAIDEFAAYLRYNLDSLGETGLAPFSAELRHAEQYLSLEKRRFNGAVNWTTDITVRDFSLPVLTLQPIVENAVHHGILKKKEGGAITIKTRRDDGMVVIEVADNGIGYESASITPHTGLFNVRHRLEMRMDGSLEIRSENGKGTVVTIRVKG
jgi:ABC-type amino acid transport substrate-binding protein/anti-sigma regulatory factor (Ser/Thr protein kinase)